MNVGERVRLSNPAPGHESVRGEVVEVNEKRNAVLVEWDGRQKQVWYLDKDLLPINW